MIYTVEDKMKVSILMVTYNHEKFIAKAINSILMQKTSFDYEIVIGEDCSTDSTRNILIDFEKKYRDKIKLLLNEKNLGMNRNVVQTLQACNGEYVAILEGDDYWTSPNKLQKQVDFLDSNSEFAICFHNVLIKYNDGSCEDRPYCSPLQKEISTVEDLLILGNFMPSCSKMYRRELLSKMPDWIFSLKMGDLPSDIYIAHKGMIGYLNEIMGVYVIHSSGAWSMMRNDKKEWYKADIECYEQLYVHLDDVYKKIVARQLNNKYLELSQEYADSGELAIAKCYAGRCLTVISMVSTKLLKVLLRLYIPSVYSLLRYVKRAAT